MPEEVNIIKSFFPNLNNGTCLDIGAMDGHSGSNTLYFEQLGWHCICVEPNPIYIKQLNNCRKIVEPVGISNEEKDDVPFIVHDVGNNNLSACSSLKPDQRLVERHKHILVNTYEISISITTVNKILEKHNIENLDFVSIDTEGTEIDVLHGFDLNKYHPKLLIIENNFEDNIIENYLKDFNYIKHSRYSVNDFYIRH